MLETDAGAEQENTFNCCRTAAWNHNVYAKHFKCSCAITQKTKND